MSIIYDNCKGCTKSTCKHFGQDRQFVVPAWGTCKQSETVKRYTKRELINLICDIAIDEQKREEERAAHYIEFNPTDEKQRNRERDIYSQAVWNLFGKIQREL